MREIRLRYMMTAAAADIGVARAQSAAAGALAAGNLADAKGGYASICDSDEPVK